MSGESLELYFFLKNGVTVDIDSLITHQVFKYTINPTRSESYIFIDEVFQTDSHCKLIQIVHQKNKS